MCGTALCRELCGGFLRVGSKRDGFYFPNSFLS